MRYVIIENEYFARENLRTIMKRLRPSYEPVFMVESVDETVAYFSTSPEVDLVFLDIELVDGNCFDILEKVQIEVPVIFTTAYDHYALRAFSVDAVDYILKPVTEDSLQRAVKRFERREVKAPVSIDMDVLRKVLRQGCAPSRVLTESSGGYAYIPVDEVAFFYSEDKYTFVRTFEGQQLMTLYPSLSRVEEEMDPQRFFRLSRGLLANIDAIKTVSKYFNGRLKVTLKSGEELVSTVVSSTRRRDFLRWYGSSGME